MKYFIHLPMKMEPTVISETSAIRTQTPGNCPKRNKLHLEHDENLKTRINVLLQKKKEGSLEITGYNKFGCHSGKCSLHHTWQLQRVQPPPTHSTTTQAKPRVWKKTESGLVLSTIDKRSRLPEDYFYVHKRWHYSVPSPIQYFIVIFALQYW